MIQLSSLMWAIGIFFAVVGFLRGWNREVFATATILLGLFGLFQLDSLLRGTVFSLISPTQTFFAQAALFIGIAFMGYRVRGLSASRRPGESLVTSILGGFFGFINGYLMAGSLWYLLDVNEYPLLPYIVAPVETSASANMVSVMPIVVMSGGINNPGDLMTIIVILLLVVVVAI